MHRKGKAVVSSIGEGVHKGTSTELCIAIIIRVRIERQLAGADRKVEVLNL